MSATIDAPAREYDAVVIGAGVSGLYQLYRLRELGLKTRVFEAGSNVEGKQTRKVMGYGGSFPSFREHCDGVVADAYRGLVMA